MGDVPWSEALQPGVIYAPKLDKQEDLYVIINQLLDDAIVNLQKETVFPSLGAQDFIYGGNAAKWLKFAYGLKARYAMRLSHRSPAYNKVVEYADKSFTSAAEQCILAIMVQQPIVLSTASLLTAIILEQAKVWLINLMKEMTRELIFFWKKHPAADGFEFAPNGGPVQVQGRYGISAISNPTAPTYMLSYHEIEFLKAEAYVRQGDNESAKGALKKAITAAFEKVNIGLTADDAEAYFDSEVLPKFNADPLKEVMNQKYIAFFEEEAIEAYNDYRRLKAMGDNVITLENPLNAGNKFPLRYTYGASDVTTNENVSNAYGDGTYVYSENVWWAGGTR